MTVKQLIKELNACDQDKVVILVEPDGIGWINIRLVAEKISTVNLIMDG